jgi:monoamine oxidase
MQHPTRRTVLTLAALAATPARPLWAAAAPDVIVLGAGLAGLNAALLLEERGLRVRVLEASARIGGRLHTLFNLPGQPETGGVQIGAAYTRTVAAAQRLGLQLGPSPRSPLLAEDGLVMFVGGQRFTRAQWAGAGSSANPFPEAVRNLPPDRALLRLMGTNPLADINAWRSAPAQTFDVPVHSELQAQGLNAEALRLLDVSNSYGQTLAQTSRLNLHYVQSNIAHIVKTPGPVQNIVGGNQRLPEAMVRALKGDVLLRCAVVAVDSTARSRVTVHCADGSRHSARFVVCALPLPALRRVTFTPGLPSIHAQAVHHLAYGHVTQLHLQVLRPFWQDDGVLPYLWSDGPLERIFPIDPLGNGQAQTLTVWINGAGTARWDALTDEQAGVLVADELARVYPASRGAVRLAQRVAWHQNPWAGGSWANWAPGQISRYADRLALPLGAVHFCGEHTALGIRGIEGAMESGERAAQEILARV